MDLVIRGADVVLSTGPVRADIAIAAGRIERIEPGVRADHAQVIDARGLHVLPGAVDAHVHFNEPGRTEWEGWATGSRALAVGGTTTCVEMPFNAIPPSVTAGDLQLKRELASRQSHVDFGLWGGIVPGNRHELAELAAAGVIGFKAFMCETGLPEFGGCDDQTLHDAMVEAGRLGLPVLVHAEDRAITERLTDRARSRGGSSAPEFCATRPVAAEVVAVLRAIALAEQTGCALHVVHVSCGQAVAAIAEAQAAGVDVSCETCPHYLVFTDDDLERLGTIAKTTPPVRGEHDREALWAGLTDGSIPMVASDHSPCPPAMKAGDFFSAWGGIAGCQSLLELLLTEAYYGRGFDLPAIAELLAGFPSRRFGLAGKGAIAPGADADLVLVELDGARTLVRDELLDRHRQSPYVGRTLRGRVVRTVLRGRTIAAEGRVLAAPSGRMLRAGALAPDMERTCGE
jgi:allantoinase